MFYRIIKIEPTRSGSDPSRSATTSSQKTVASKGIKLKYLITVNFAGMGEFEFNMDPASCRKTVEASFPPFYRRFKYELRRALKQRVLARNKEQEVSEEQADILEGADIPDEVDEEPLPELTPEIWESARADVPLGIDPYIWEEFVDMEKNPEKIAKNKVNAESKSMQTVHHTLGRCTYHNKKHKLDEPGEEVVPPSTTEKWLYEHVRRDGSVHPSAVESYNKVRFMKGTKQKESIPALAM
ncbi:hypothetical protein C5167_015884 [Papaver somniferum]|nr:hypothetical protein C5167_015884 [Papaver somniferum]